jgi:hypothetical protein
MRAPVQTDGGYLSASGATVPSAEYGFQPGCIFQDTANGVVYVNEGTLASCSFKAIDPDPQDDTFEVGEFASLVAGSGIAVAAGSPAAAVYGDDNGVAFGNSVYNLRARLLLTVDQAAGTCRAMGAQLKLATGVDVETGVYTANQGHLELDGTHIAKSGATLSCMDASLEIGTSLTVNSGGEACGLHVETTGAGTITNNGTCAGILIDKASGAASWPDGILILGSDVVKGIRVGKFATSAATTSAVPFVAAQDVYGDGQLDTVEIHGSSAVDLTSLKSAKCLRARHVVSGTALTVAHETYGAVGQLVVKGTTLTHLHAGVMGTFEGHTSGCVVNGAYQYGIGAIMARCGGGGAITATKDLAGYTALWDGAALASGESVALAIGDTGTVGWTHGIGVERCTNLLDLPAAGTDPVIANTLIPATAPTAETVGADACLRVLVNNVAYYIPLYDTLHG